MSVIEGHASCGQPGVGHSPEEQRETYKSWKLAEHKQVGGKTI